jgi:hypothetical protein
MVKVNQAPTGAIFMNNDGSTERYYGTIENGKYKGIRTRTSLLESIYCVAYGMAYEYSKAVFNTLDWIGKKLVYLIDHSDFFAGVVWTLAVMTAWEVLTR